MRFLALATTATLLLSGCGAHGVAAPVALKTLSATSQAAAAHKADPSGASWGMNDGLQMNANEEKVFALLPGALKPTPSGKLYRNLVSNFIVRVGPANKRFWSFSGTRLMAQSLFVPTLPSYEWFFSGVYDSETGEMSVYREVPMASEGKRK